MMLSSSLSHWGALMRSDEASWTFSSGMTEKHFYSEFLGSFLNLNLRGGCWLVRFPLRLCCHCSDRHEAVRRGGGGAGRGPDPGLENQRHMKEELIVGTAALWPPTPNSSPSSSLCPLPMHTQIRFSYISLAAYHVIVETYAQWSADVLWVHREAEGYMVLWENSNNPLLLVLMSLYCSALLFLTQ